DRLRHGPRPGLVDLVERAAHADAVDLAACGERADHDRNVVLPLLAVDDAAEEKRLAVRRLDTAAELPADQGGHLGVLVARPVDRHEETRAIERLEVLVEVGIAARGASSTLALRLRFRFRIHSGRRVYQRSEANIATPRRSASANSSSRTAAGSGMP